MRKELKSLILQAIRMIRRTTIIAGALLISSVVACRKESPLDDSLEVFRFRLASPERDSEGRELWSATVGEEETGKRIPTTFRLWLDTPGRAAPTGSGLQGVIR